MRRVERRTKLIVAHAVGAAVLVGALAWWLAARGEAPADESPVGSGVAGEAAAEPPAQEPPQEAPADADTDPLPVAPAPVEVGVRSAGTGLPPLAESDVFVREWLGADTPPAWNDWLARAGLVHFVAVILDNAARGEVPRRALSFISVGRFSVVEARDRIFISPASHARYDALMDAALALPPELAAALLQRLDPLIETALGEMGVHDASPRTLTYSAIVRVLATPIPEGGIALERPAVHYEFADADLEALLPLQKQLLRTGPANTAKAQRYARELRAALKRLDR